MGLEGELPDSIDPSSVKERIEQIEASSELNLLSKQPLHIEVATDLIYHRIDRLDFHANGMVLVAFDADEQKVHQATFYSVGGGFIVQEDEQEGLDSRRHHGASYVFHNAETLIQLCHEHDKNIAQIMMENEKIMAHRRRD